jgi:predicted nucleic acid-binding protein
VPTSALYFDSNVFITYLEGSPTDSARLQNLFELLRQRLVNGVTSELTLGEVLAGSHKYGPQIKRAYLDLIVWSGNIKIVPVTRDVLYQSAELCGVHKKTVGRKLTLVDAIHLATAIQAKCSHFVSADKSIAVPQDMSKIDFMTQDIDRVWKALA